MTATSRLRGHLIEYLNGEWVYSDTKEPTYEVGQQNKKRECGHCGLWATKEGHDACIANLPNVMNACCGHGIDKEAYVQFWDRSCVRGEDAIKNLNILKKGI